ncbi:MAG: Fic family protein [Christensenellaceae bacterium]|jgi:Fic family protein|nr:Fic family protein [Christensenellaceae bacterium]
MGYTPPYTITEEMLAFLMEIAENLGKIRSVNNLESLPRLRKISRIKSVHSSLVIENCCLSLDEVVAIFDGKKVIGPPDEIKSVENAFIAYKEAETTNPFELSDLLKTHGLMMQGLVLESGKLRTTGEGVFSEDGKLVHMAPPANMLPSLMDDLFAWLKTSKTHDIIKSCIFHYEFEFIHPFRDGNGRMGRLWQTVILANWKQIFWWIPVETIILKRQQEYYDAIAESTKAGNSNAFILYLLEAILDAVKNIVDDAKNHTAHISIYIKKLLSAMSDVPMTANEIMEILGIKSKESFRKNYVVPAIEAGVVALEFPEKPTSKNQRYYKK